MATASEGRGYEASPANLGELLQGALAGLAHPPGAGDMRRAPDCWVLRLTAADVPLGFSFLRDEPDLLLSQLTDITAVDAPERGERFDLVYGLLSMHHNFRLRVKVAVGEDETVPSLCGLYPVANWLEREVWDMFGIPFGDHPDLRRILTDYGFEGHPLRKDFPLTGHVEVRYDEERKAVIYESVHLQQAYRSFEFESPWEEVSRLFPGPGAVGDGEGSAEK
ncbi:MAG: NADH-quinone oxidoreductase subunit C [Alphaproteobacteria bacterium]|nr:NADH-quinone oxidoreductase subunit C [Alphaproteobacteria bacterium]